MLNKEKFAKEIIEIVVNGRCVSIVNGKPCSCCNTFCDNCDFRCETCTKEFKEWANSEYKEIEIDWERVPVDTPVLVWNYDKKYKKKRYYAGRDETKFMTFYFGATSWSCNSDEETTFWSNCELVRKEDIQKYRKR